MLTAGFGRRTPYTQYTIRNTQYAVCLKGGRRTIRNTQYAIRNHAHSRLRASHPIRNTQYAIRNHAHSRPLGVAPHTQYAIRNTQYATCLTEPCCQYAKPSLNTQSLNTLRKPYWTPLPTGGSGDRSVDPRGPCGRADRRRPRRRLRSEWAALAHDVTAGTTWDRLVRPGADWYWYDLRP